MIAEKTRNFDGRTKTEEAPRLEHAPDGLTFAAIPGGRRPLYHVYPGQVKPQPAYLELDEHGRVSVGWNGSVGDVVPPEVYHRRSLRYPLPADISRQAIADLLADVRPWLSRIHAGHSITWNGRDRVGVFSEAASVADETIYYHLATLEPDEYDTGMDDE